MVQPSKGDASGAGGPALAFDTLPVFAYVIQVAYHLAGVFSVKSSCLRGRRLCLPGQSAANSLGLFAKRLTEYLRKGGFPRTLTLAGSSRPVGVCVAWNFAFLFPSRKRPLVDLHVELMDKVYAWNSRVSSKEKYYLSLQHTLRKKLILSTWKPEALQVLRV